MIVPIEINSSDITSQFDISEQEIENMFDNIAKSLAIIYYTKLESEAANTLHSTRARFINSIQLVDTGRLEGTVLLDYSKDPLIRMIEEGASPFDMKYGLLNSPKAKVGKDGKRYISIPFRLATSDANGEADVFTGRMPEEITEAVRKLVIPVGKNNSNALPISAIPSQYQIKGKRNTIEDSAGKTLFKEYEHKTSLYEGVVKSNDSVTAQSTYHMFRRVSENSSPDAFIHPGFTAARLMDRAYSRMNIDEELGIQIDNELTKLGF